MKAVLISLIVAAATSVVMAHGNNDHVRGTVTQVSAQAITVQTTASKTRSLTLTDKTSFLKGGRKAVLTDLKVGDRVVIDVPKDGSEALVVQFGAAAPKAAAAAHQHPASGK